MVASRNPSLGSGSMPVSASVWRTVSLSKSEVAPLVGGSEQKSQPPEERQRQTFHAAQAAVDLIRGDSHRGRHRAHLRRRKLADGTSAVGHADSYCLTSRMSALGQKRT